MKCNRENLILQFFLFGEKEQDLIISKRFILLFYPFYFDSFSICSEIFPRKLFICLKWLTLYFDT